MDKDGRHLIWTTERGFAYYGAVRLPFRIVPGGLEFAVKEMWLRPEYGDKIVMSLAELSALVSTADKEGLDRIVKL